jgi:hypothetical protein
MYRTETYRVRLTCPAISYADGRASACGSFKKAGISGPRDMSRFPEYLPVDRWTALRRR